MKPTFLFVLLFILGVHSAIAADAPKMSPEHQMMMKEMEKASRPGEQHKMLADLKGKWTYTSKFWQSADAKPEESTGMSTMKMIMDGRYLQQEATGKMMGKTYTGMGLIGYDNVKQRFETLWIDNMGTSMMKGIGQYDTQTKTLSDKGEFSCPMTKSKTAEYRSEMKIVDSKNMTYTMYGKGMTGEGEEFKMMELTYKRK